MTDAPRLGDLPGSILVSRRAAQEYADATGLGEEEARRELTRHLLEARMTHAAVGDTPANWRFRRRSAGVDITARVVEDDGLHVVVRSPCVPTPRGARAVGRPRRDPSSPEVGRLHQRVPPLDQVRGEPSEPHEVVLVAAVARDLLEQGEPVSLLHMAVLSGASESPVSYQHARRLATAGEIRTSGERGPGVRSVPAEEARRWLGARGVEGFRGA